MEWKVPKQNDRRDIEIFLWFPRKINGIAKWLVTAKIHQWYDLASGWIDSRWIDE